MLKFNSKQLITLAVYSIPNTFLSFGIIFIINNVISNYEAVENNGLGISFFAIVVYSYLMNLFFQKKIILLTNKFIYENELKIISKIRDMPYLNLQQLKTERIYGIIEDLRSFVFFPTMFTNVVNSILMIIVCMIYLYTISAAGASIILFLIIVLSLTYLFISNFLSKDVNLMRNLNDFYHRYIQDILKGFKELRISSIRRGNLFNNYVKPNRNNAQELDLNLSFKFITLGVFGQYGLYLVLGMILFLLPITGMILHKDLISFIVILLFMSSPVNRLISTQQLLTKAFVSFKRVKIFFEEFSDIETKIVKNDASKLKFDSLEFRNCSFNYPNGNFTIGPINLTIRKEETIFIIGGNGSGKSTFINMLTGLYQPISGEILLNGKPIENDSQEYQNLLSVIFTDNYLYSENYENYSLKDNNEYLKLLEVMKLNEVVADDSEESARRNFSKGQSKRMSMIFALLEQHPILVLDEWAADQDPYFRKYFYENLIPKLKKDGKVIIAVTHDDAYFEHADRIIKFDFGKIVKDIKIKEQVFDKEILWSN